MSSRVDDGSIPNDAMLLRRIHPNQIVDDKNTGKPRVSSGAFKDLEMSVDVEPILHAMGEDWHFSLRNHPTHSLVRLVASVARENGQAVVYAPIPDENDAHAEVIGKKSPGIANKLRDASIPVYIFNK
jgi:hypothetical protein